MQILLPSGWYFFAIEVVCVASQPSMFLINRRRIL